MSRCQVWSNHKQHSTIKFLIGNTPQGTIFFISKCAGGRISDKEIFEQSIIINFLIPDIINLLGYIFYILNYSQETLCWLIKVHVPRSCQHSYGRGENPSLYKRETIIRKVEIDWNSELLLVRIHVEQLIGILKQKYHILQNIIPISLILSKLIIKMFQLLIKLSLYVVHSLTYARLLFHRIKLNFDYFE